MAAASGGWSKARRFAGEHDERDASARRHRQRRRDLGEAGPAGDGSDADLAGRQVIAHCHRTGAVLVAHRKGGHAIEILHGGGPMHVAVPHQGEMGVDTLRREGFGQGCVDGLVLHGGAKREDERMARHP